MFAGSITTYMNERLRQGIIWFILTSIVSGFSLWYVLTIRVPRSVETKPALQVVGAYDALFSDLAIDWLFFQYPTISSILTVVVIAISMSYIAVEIESYF